MRNDKASSLISTGTEKKKAAVQIFYRLFEDDLMHFLFCKVSFIKKHSVYNILVLPLLED